jgi:hypothetical protein
MANLRPLKRQFIRLLVYLPLAAVVFLVFWERRSNAGDSNGFDLTGALVPINEIHQGGPPRDGIPALDNPSFVSAEGAGFLKKDDYVLGMTRNGISKAYPIRILNWHEIVNDRFGQDPVVVSYCPLCGSGIAYSAYIDGAARSFGVSGLLYNSDLLLYDRESESLWSQIEGKAISGSLKGERLRLLTVFHTTWSEWRKLHPRSSVLSLETGFRRDYARDPYDGYQDSEALYFPVKYKDRRYHPKERIIGIEINGAFKAYPFTELGRVKGRVLKDRIGGAEIEVRFNVPLRSGQVFDTEGAELPSVNSFWFAWIAFHPETAVFQSTDHR